MGKLIQCSSKLAKEPYHFPLTKTNVYSLEEVCYYIRHNIYMMQEEIFDRDFAHWVNRELGLGETADKLEKLISEHHNLKDIVVTICCSCDYYEEDEIRELIQIMDDLEKLPMYARRKYKGDSFLKCASYEKAIEEYDKIFESDEILQADGKVYGDLFHNMAIAYVHLGELKKASEFFLKAYEKNEREESLFQCAFALRLNKDVAQYKKLINDLEISSAQQLAWEEQFKSAQERAEQSAGASQIRKLRVLYQNGAMNEYNEKVNRMISEWKNEYRKQIRV